MLADGTWGDHVILHGAANCFQTCIHVISSLPHRHDVMICPEFDVTGSNRLVLGHMHELHYVSLIPQIGGRRRSNSIPWCTSFHVIILLSLRTWHIMISNLQHARNEHRSARCGWFQTCFVSAASAFEIIELAYIRYALKENFSVTLSKKGFTCVSLICRELPLVRSVAL